MDVHFSLSPTPKDYLSVYCHRYASDSNIIFPIRFISPDNLRSLHNRQISMKGLVIWDVKFVCLRLWVSATLPTPLPPVPEGDGVEGGVYVQLVICMGPSRGSQPSQSMALTMGSLRDLASQLSWQLRTLMIPKSIAFTQRFRTLRVNRYFAKFAYSTCAEKTF